jgi:fibronectin type 3 domain-containing protein
VAGYDVFRSEVSGGPYSKLDANLVASDTYVDTTVLAGLTYYYVVTSVTSSGVQSANSAQASATVPTP